MIIDVYVPAAAHLNLIDPGSGIVGTLDGGRLMVDFEGNRLGAVNIVTYADRVHHAAGRQQERYPTIARSWVSPDEAVAVGVFDTDTGVITPGTATLDEAAAREAIATWIGVPAADLDAQLVTAGSVRHQMLREARAALTHPDPAVRAGGQFMNERYSLGL